MERYSWSRLTHLQVGWYAEYFVKMADSLVLRWFCRVAFHEVPDASTLWRWEQTLETIQNWVLV